MRTAQKRSMDADALKVIKQTVALVKKLPVTKAEASLIDLIGLLIRHIDAQQNFPRHSAEPETG